MPNPLPNPVIPSGAAISASIAIFTVPCGRENVATAAGLSEEVFASNTPSPTTLQSDGYDQSFQPYEPPDCRRIVPGTTGVGVGVGDGVSVGVGDGVGIGVGGCVTT